jgi:hypothetical protein
MEGLKRIGKTRQPIRDDLILHQFGRQSFG